MAFDVPEFKRLREGARTGDDLRRAIRGAGGEPGRLLPGGWLEVLCADAVVDELYLGRDG